MLAIFSVSLQASIITLYQNMKPACKDLYYEYRTLNTLGTLNTGTVQYRYSYLVRGLLMPFTVLPLLPRYEYEYSYGYGCGGCAVYFVFSTFLLFQIL